MVNDIGRVGGVLSTTSPANGGYDVSGWCGNPAHGFATPVDGPGGADQIMGGVAMDRMCAKEGCQFIVNTGDNFYECGLDNPVRWQTDFVNVYQTHNTPSIMNLTWYNVIGNHDIVADGSVDAQIAYTQNNSKWQMPGRFYANEIHDKHSDLRLRFVYANTNPFVTKYAKANYKYNTSEFRAHASPQNITDQLNFLEGALNSSTATWDIVVGHHPVFGGASANGFNASAIVNTDANDFGRPTADGTPSWSAMLAMVRKHNPAAYFNGHDHQLVSAHDAENPTAYTTRYVTSGAGSYPDDLCYTIPRPYLDFSYLTLQGSAANCSAVPPPVYPTYVGFNLVTVTPTHFTVDYFVSSPNGWPMKVYSDVKKVSSGSS
ncbi:MAG: hypothetical protein WDW36_003700 [Sanguina aurantia]